MKKRTGGRAVLRRFCAQELIFAAEACKLYGQKNQGGVCMKQAIALAGGGTKGAYQVGA